jgi:hypothetical protein
LLQRLAADSAFAGVDVVSFANPLKVVGRAPEQVLEFEDEVVAPIRDRYAHRLEAKAEIKV